jgi:hypothetical protein
MAGTSGVLNGTIPWGIVANGGILAYAKSVYLACAMQIHGLIFPSP